jgi:hypothetical protein
MMQQRILFCEMIFQVREPFVLSVWNLFITVRPCRTRFSVVSLESQSGGS